MVDCKRSLTVLDIVGLFAFEGVVWSVISLSYSASPLVSIVGWFLAYSGFAFMLVLVVSTYLHLIDNVVSGAVKVLVPFFIGFSLIQFIILQKFEVLVKVEAALPSSAILLIWFGIRGYAFSEAVFHRLPMPEREIRKVVTRFPPNSFHDLWPFHFFMATILFLMPMVIRALWGG